MKNKFGNSVGGIAFLVGVVLAIIVGLFNLPYAWLTILLVILGIFIGILNVADKETQPFLISGAVLIIASSMGQDLFSQIDYLKGILPAILALFVPATIVVAVRNVFLLARH